MLYKHSLHVVDVVRSDAGPPSLRLPRPPPPHPPVSLLGTNRFWIDQRRSSNRPHTSSTAAAAAAAAGCYFTARLMWHVGAPSIVIGGGRHRPPVIIRSFVIIIAISQPLLPSLAHTTWHLRSHPSSAMAAYRPHLHWDVFYCHILSFWHCSHRTQSRVYGTVYLSHCPASEACGGFAAEGPAGRLYRPIALRRAANVAAFQCISTAARRSAANASSVVFT